MAKNVRKNKRGHIEADIDLQPMMNLFTVLIPFLLACASFASIKIIDINLPETRVSQPQKQVKDKDDEGLLLSIFITDEGISLGARGAMLPTTFTHEYHKYVYSVPKGSKNEKTYLHKIDKKNRSIQPKAPENPNRTLTLFEREEIILYAVEKESQNDEGKVMTALYNEFDNAMTNAAGVILDKRPSVGDTIYVLSLNNRKQIVVKDPMRYKVKKLTVYDQLASRLLRIRAKYPDVPDQGEIKVIAEDDVVFDKLIHVMDICRMFGYPKISLAKVAG